jgi:hypothetical protein
MSRRTTNMSTSHPKAFPPLPSEDFRDHFSGVNEDGKRNWFYPQKPKGFWHNRRIGFTVVILSLLFITPFIKYDHQPILLFNVLERKFIIFGLFIGPQDYWLFGLTMLSFIVFIVLFTTGVAGPARRLFLWKWYSVRSSTSLKVTAANRSC